MVAPVLYDAVVGHSRHVDVAKTFRHRVYNWLVDLDDMPRFPWWLRPFARFEARDHLGSPERSIRQNVDHWLRLRGIDLRGGQVLMLAHARVLGYVFNPLTVFWCHYPDGELACVLAEVHNTYGERHCYLLRPDGSGQDEVDKQFYVSPFLPSRGHYEMRFEPPGERLRVTIRLVDGETPLLTAVVAGRRRPATHRELLRMLVRRPLVPQRVAALIRWHGISLWLRRIPIVPRRPHQHQEGIR